MENIRIIVATHKPYWMPEDPMYLPLQVGRAVGPDLGYTGDDTGDQISAKNPHYCELTGMYWAWKNLQADWIGLVHYRRYFSNGRRTGNKRERILDREGMASLLGRCGLLVPRARHYRIETNYSQYAHSHHARDLDLTREILRGMHPEDLAAFDTVMKRTWVHLFNMLVTDRDTFGRYCEWLFGILTELERQLDISSYTGDDARVFGLVSERLLDVWLESTGTPRLEVPYVFLDKQNWLVKGGRFLKRKLVSPRGSGKPKW